MHQILVAVFDTVANADTAVQALENADVSSASIRRYHRDDPAMENLGTRTSTHVGPVSTAAMDADRVHQRSSGFWAWLTGEEGGTTVRPMSRIMRTMDGTSIPAAQFLR